MIRIPAVGQRRWTEEKEFMEIAFIANVFWSMINTRTLGHSTCPVESGNIVAETLWILAETDEENCVLNWKLKKIWNSAPPLGSVFGLYENLPVTVWACRQIWYHGGHPRRISCSSSIVNNCTYGKPGQKQGDQQIDSLWALWLLESLGGAMKQKCRGGAQSCCLMSLIPDSQKLKTGSLVFEWQRSFKEHRKKRLHSYCLIWWQ